MFDDAERINRALRIAVRYGGIDGEHHKAWVIDQMVRALTGCPILDTKETMGESQAYRNLVALAKSGDDGPETFAWDEGITP